MITPRSSPTPAPSSKFPLQFWQSEDVRLSVTPVVATHEAVDDEITHVSRSNSETWTSELSRAACCRTLFDFPLTSNIGDLDVFLAFGTSNTNCW
jgi:hypothetical protein